MCAGLFYPSSVGVPDSLRQGWGLHQWYGIIGDSSRECPQPPGERQSGQRIQREDDRRDASWIAKTPKMCYDHYHSETQDSQPTGIPQWALKFRSVDGSSAQPRSLRVSNLNRFQTKEAVISLQVLYQWFFFSPFSRLLEVLLVRVRASAFQTQIFATDLMPFFQQNKKRNAHGADTVLFSRLYTNSFWYLSCLKSFKSKWSSLLNSL